MHPVLIIGCGDIGIRAGRLASAAGLPVIGLVRSPEGVDRLRQAGIEPLQADLMDQACLEGLPTRNAWVLYSAPPPGGGHADAKIRHFLAAIKPGAEPAKLVYLSTSGVYGDCSGEVVTEATPVNPSSARARRRWDAECCVRQFGEERSVPTVVLRVTGIYGPHRFPLHYLLQKHPMLRREEAPFTNRIHADDLAQVCFAALEKGRDGDLFNVCDGQQSSMTDYFMALADAFCLERPPEVGMEEAKKVMNPMMLSYLQESRRMENGKMLRELGITLRYPDLQSGLAASAREMLEEQPDLIEQLASRLSKR